MRKLIIVIAAVAAEVVFGVESDWEQNPLDHGQSITVSVDFAVKGRPVRVLNGINGGPTAKSARAAQMKDFKPLNIPSVRLHDIPLSNPGAKLVDVQDIFPIWNEKADPADASFYFFDQTDDYIATLRECGVKEIVYRLGTSIEWTSPRQHFAKYPKNVTQYVEVCAGIVRHYLKGWAGGFDGGGLRWKWEVWNEPNLKGACFDRDLEWYFDLYARISKRLHSEFPGIEVGGPALTGLDMGFLKGFFEYCRKEDAPVEFCTWHSYFKTPLGGKWALARIEELRKWMDENDWGRTKLYLTEWNYFPCTWTDFGSPEGRLRWQRGTADGMHGIDAAAFLALCLTRWQAIPLDGAHLYMFQHPNWGFYSPEGAKYPTYWAFRFFGEFAMDEPVLVQVDDGGGNFAVLAGETSAGERRILISDFKPGEGEMEVPRSLPVRGVPEKGVVRVRMLDGFSSVPRTEDISYEGGEIVLPRKKVSGSAVYLVDWKTL